MEHSEHFQEPLWKILSRMLSRALALPEYLILQGNSSLMWATLHAGPEKASDKRTSTNTQARRSKYKHDKLSITGRGLNPRLPWGKQSLLVLEGGARRKLTAQPKDGWQLSGQTVTSQRAPMPLNQQAPKTNKLLFTLGFGLNIVVRGKKRKWIRQQAEV